MLKNLKYALAISLISLGIPERVKSQERPYSGTWEQTSQNAYTDFKKNLVFKVNEHKTNIEKASQLARFNAQLDAKNFDKYHYDDASDEAERIMRKLYQSALNQTWKDVRKNRWEPDKEEPAYGVPTDIRKSWYDNFIFGARQIKLGANPSFRHGEPDIKLKLTTYDLRLAGIYFKDAQMNIRANELEASLTKRLDDKTSLNFSTTINGETKFTAGIGYQIDKYTHIALGLTHTLGTRNIKNQSILKQAYEDQKAGTYVGLNLFKRLH